MEKYLPRQGFVTYKSFVSRGLRWKKDLKEILKAYALDVKDNGKGQLKEEFY